MRLPDGAEVRWGVVALLAAFLVLTIVLAFVAPAVGWMLIALILLTAGVVINPSKRKRGRKDRRGS